MLTFSLLFSFCTFIALLLALPLLFQGFAEQVFDLAVQTTEILLCPNFEFFEHIRIDP